MGIFGGKSDNIPAFISTPILFYQQLFPTDYKIDSAYIIADKKENLETAGFGAKSIIESRHNNRGKDIYSLENTLKQLDQVNKVLSIFTAFISAVAAISLLVGGIGVMNIMLVSVTERTREIGLRMAIGATGSNIRNQFLIEALVLCLLGGIAGVLTGIAGSSIISGVFGWPTSVTILSVLLSVGFSAVIGIFFGFYPANKAANMDPIEALRYEK
jgi:putative ABC transport system permease protein